MAPPSLSPMLPPLFPLPFLRQIAGARVLLLPLSLPFSVTLRPPLPPPPQRTNGPDEDGGKKKKSFPFPSVQTEEED